MRRFDAWAVIVVAVLVTVVVFQRSAIGELTTQVSGAESDVSRLRGIVVDLAHDIAEVRTKADNNAVTLASHCTVLDSVAVQLFDLRQAQREQESRGADHQERIGTLEDDLARQVRDLAHDQWDQTIRCLDHQRRIEELELDALEDRDANGWGRGSMVPDNCTPVAPAERFTLGAPESVQCGPPARPDLLDKSAPATPLVLCVPICLGDFR